MSRFPLSRRRLLFVGGAVAASVAAGAWLRRSGEDRAGYPFARRAAGLGDPLWNVPPERLATATEEDARRLEGLVAKLDEAVRAVEGLDPRLSGARTGDLTGDERDALREAWWRVFEPILATDEIKNRYQGWYGIDYLKHPRLHARAFALSFAGLCAQVDAGLRLLAALNGKPLLPVLFDEAMPRFGLPSRTFSAVRQRLGRARDLFLIPFGNEWYDHWMVAPLAGDAGLGPIRERLDALRRSAMSRVLTPTSTGVANKIDLLKGEFCQRWFPLQKHMAEWAGDTRVARQDRRLVDDAQLAAFKAALEPGDVILERRNWYLSNIGLPGFWPHAALYTGSQAQILKALADDPDVKSAYGEIGARFSQKYPTAWASLSGRDPAGHEHCVVEAVSEGVCAASIEHSCAADYVAALRPRVPPIVKARAVERALAFYGRPYDFDFNFATDDQVVCSELVIKAYEPGGTSPGLGVPYVELLGRRAVTPTDFARHFRDHLGTPEQQLDFVYFLEGRERERRAVVADARAFAATCDRPKWDIAQP